LIGNNKQGIEASIKLSAAIEALKPFLKGASTGERLALLGALTELAEMQVALIKAPQTRKPEQSKRGNFRRDVAMIDSIISYGASPANH
jgi:hypothetical protein